MLTPFSIPVPLGKKLVEDEAARKLQERVEELKRNYRPGQGWLDAPENAVNRQR